MGIAQNLPQTGTNDSVLDLVRLLPPEKRRSLSVELAPRRDAPADLMRFFALDEIVIAEPVILQSPVLTEDDLCTIARIGSPAHIAKLRQRPSLSVKVRRALDPPKPLEPQILSALRHRNLFAFHNLFSKAAGKEGTSALDALEAGNGAPLAMACKHAGLSRAAYSSIVILFDIAHLRPADKTEALLNAYDTEQAA